MTIQRGTRMHLLGMGGIGVSGLAAVCLERGCVVSGCDAKPNSVSYRLQVRGARIGVGHDPAHLTEPFDLVVYSAAVSPYEPELCEARARGIRTISRGELLAELTAQSPLVAVAGAHGKTTTSAMAAQLLLQSGWEPTFIIGGLMCSTGTNAHAGTGTYIVAETDESDGSFLQLSASTAIVTNIDREHLNHYQTFERLIAAFQQFVRQIRPGGTLIYCYDDLIVRGALFHPSQLGYGFDRDADVSVQQLRLHGYGSAFQVACNGRSLGTFTLQMPGRHNVLNALAVISLGLTLDLPVLTIKEALASFEGTQRRFQLVRLSGDIWFVEDYAHHPAEIQATLAADTIVGRHRLVVFQPHRFSRTQSLEREFTRCFDRADGVIVTDIYPASETPIPGISGERLARLIKARGHPCVRYVPKSEVPSYVTRIARAGDTIFFLGAGDIGEMCHAVAADLRPTARAAG